mgnify:CR=1 FL=1
MHRRSLLKGAGAAALASTLPMPAAASNSLPLQAPIHVGQVGLRVRDAEALAGWYSAALGLEEIRRRGIRLLPQTLAEALQELKQDELVQSSLGVIYDEFATVKEGEWREYHRQVTQWELDRYLTMF